MTKACPLSLRLLVAIAASSLAAPALAQSNNRQVSIGISGTVAAQCNTAPFRVLVENGVVLVTQYLRCNHPGRYVIRLDARHRIEWSGSLARHRGRSKQLDPGYVEFEVPPGEGTLETFVIEPKNPAAADEIAADIQTQLTVQ